MLLKVECSLVLCLIESRSGTSQKRRVDQAVVFDEPDKHAGENPRHSRLRQILFAPRLEHLRGALGLLCALVCRSERLAERWHFGRALAEVDFELTEQLFQV